jgi:hypothetical protein
MASPEISGSGGDERCGDKPPVLNALQTLSISSYESWERWCGDTPPAFNALQTLSMSAYESLESSRWTRANRASGSCGGRDIPLSPPPPPASHWITTCNRGASS